MTPRRPRSRQAMLQQMAGARQERWGGRPPTASTCQSRGVEHHSREASVGEVSTIGLDLAKLVFQAHGADASGGVVFRKKLRRDQVLAFFASQPRCVVAMEACAGAHHWARELAALGHEPRLIPPPYVKPFVKRQKNDMADAEAICEAAQRPTMRFVQPKSVEQQAAGTVFRTRDLLVRQRSQLINALRGHLTEFGMVARKGSENAPKLIAFVMDPASDLLPETRFVLKVLAEPLQLLDAKIAVLDVEIKARARSNALAKRLMTIPGVGAVLATAMVARLRRRRHSGVAATSPPG